MQKEHAILMKKYSFFVASLTVVLTLASVAYAYTRPVKYKTSLYFRIAQIERQETTDYQYDDYYGQKSAELLGQTILSWFLTPSFVVDIYHEANMDPNATSLEKLTSRFRAKALSSQNVVVTFTQVSEDAARKLAKATTQTVEKEAKKLDQTDQGAQFTVEAGTPIIVATKTSLWIVGLASFICGLLGGTLIVYLKHYLETSHKEKE